MSNHLGDTNKKVSDTPRMNAARNAAMEHMTGDVWRVGCQLERELNAANAKIKRLEEMYEGVIGEQPELLGSNVMGLLKRELNFAQKRIKRLEEALDTLTLVVGLTPIVGNKYALQEAMDMARAELKAKEEKI